MLSIGRQRYCLNAGGAEVSCVPGDSLHFYAQFYPLYPNQHPGEFDFSRYLQQKQVHAQMVPVTAIEQKGHSRRLLFLFSDARRYLMNKTEALFRDTTLRTLANALALGFKDDLDRDLKQLFIHTGTVHLLSVSGLHTGAIYLLLLYLFQSLGFRGKHKEWAVLPFLWAYACLTGLSPSVVRAATILSFITAGKTLCRTYIPLNAIAASAFISLLANPFLIHSLSFQLSYSAYTGIIVFYPFLNRLLRLPPLAGKLYSCCCLSLSAQLPTLPICAYYFHSLHLNGFLANIIAVPLATLLLYSSMICLLLPLFISQYLVFLPQTAGTFLLRFLRYFEPFSHTVPDLYPTVLQVVLIYLYFCSFCLFFFRRKTVWLKITVMALLAGHLERICTNRCLSGKQEIVLLRYYDHSALLLNYHGYYTLLKSDLPDQTLLSPYLRSHKLRPLPASYGFQNASLQWYPPCLHTPNATVCIDSFSGPAPHTVFILTTGVPPGTLFPTDSRHWPESVFSCCPLSPRHIREWQQFCRLRHISFQMAQAQGYIRIPLK